MERYRFEARVHGEQQIETAATSALAHIQQFAVASTTESGETLVGRADVEWHVMGEDTVVEQATAKEITHEDTEVAAISTQSVLSVRANHRRLTAMTITTVDREFEFDEFFFILKI